MPSSFGKTDRMLEPCLEVAGTGLDDGARSEAVSRELRERDLGEIVEGSVAMLAGRADVDVRAAGIAVLEKRKLRQHRCGRYRVQTWKHASVTQDAYIVERRLDC